MGLAVYVNRIFGDGYNSSEMASPVFSTKIKWIKKKQNKTKKKKQQTNKKQKKKNKNKTAKNNNNNNNNKSTHTLHVSQTIHMLMRW